MENYRIGIDGGGTKTRAVVLNTQLKILGEGASGSSNIYAVGIESALQNILESADCALTEASLRREQIAGWGLGLGGVASNLESARVEAALREHIGAEIGVSVVEDVVAAHRGAFDWEQNSATQIVCIAGTGANCFGRNSEGKTAKSDGLGPLLGDRGSGYRIGEAALRLYGLESDGVTAETALSPAILAHFGAENTDALIQIVYASDFERARVASLAPLVVQLAEDNVSTRRILESAGEDLAQTARAVLRRLGDESGEVALVGGVLSGAARVRRAFEAALGADVKLVEAKYESAIGAALLV